MKQRFNRKVAEVKDGTLSSGWGTTITFGPGDLFMEVQDSRRDEDPRHQWCDGCSKHDHLPKPHPLTHCHRCDFTYIEILQSWKEEQTPGWDFANLNWEQVDPKRRSPEQARQDCRDSVCDGERRKREGWSLEYRDA